MTYMEFLKALLYVCDDLAAREQELCDYDSGVGDGDHGVTIRKGFTAVREAIEREKPKDIQALCMSCAMAFSNTSGGAIGPVLSAFFLGMMNAAPGEDQFSTPEIAVFFEAGLKQVKAIGGAEVGDKTLVDALEPAVEVLKTELGKVPKMAMTAAAEAAYKGAQSTIDMVSRKGRSKNLGERSRGHVDAGSMSIYYFFRAFAECL
jgi:dihydroxyacetone kinase-like protein